MTEFRTSAFTFELPGDWYERSVQTHQSPDRSLALLVTRDRRGPSDPSDLEVELTTLPLPPDVEREVLHDRRVDLGVLEGQDVGLVRRSKRSAEYHRVVRVNYFELDLAFQGAGPIGRRDAVDACVDQVLSTVLFRQR